MNDDQFTDVEGLHGKILKIGSIIREEFPDAESMWGSRLRFEDFADELGLPENIKDRTEVLFDAQTTALMMLGILDLCALNMPENPMLTSVLSKRIREAREIISSLLK